MAKIEGFMIRIAADKHSRLKELSDRTGLKLTDLGRVAVDGLLDYVEAHNGKLPLPLDFSTFFTEVRSAVEASGNHAPSGLKVAETPPGYNAPPRKTSGEQ